MHTYIYLYPSIHSFIHPSSYLSSTYPSIFGPARRFPERKPSRAESSRPERLVALAQVHLLLDVLVHGPSQNPVTNFLDLHGKGAFKGSTSPRRIRAAVPALSLGTCACSGRSRSLVGLRRKQQTKAHAGSRTHPLSPGRMVTGCLSP